MIGAALMAREEAVAPSPMSGRLVVCPTPIGNLEDVTLRVLAALRDADVVACEDTRRTRVLLERYGVQAALVATTSTTSASGPPSWSPACRTARWWRSSPTRGCRSCPTRATSLVQGCVAAGLGVEVLPGPVGRARRARRSALPADAWRFAGFLPRKRAGIVDAFAGAETLVAFESPRRVAASLAVLAELDPERPVAVCRELTKLHEEVVRGRAADLAARYAAEPPRGEVVLVVGGAPPRSGVSPEAVDAVRRLVAAGARPRVAARRGRGAHGRHRQRALPRGHRLAPLTSRRPPARRRCGADRPSARTGAPGTRAAASRVRPAGPCRGARPSCVESTTGL